MTAPTFPRWVWADAAPFTEGLRAEIAFDQFVDYVRVQGVWRQKTHPMTNKESVTPERCWLHDWRTRACDWPAVEAGMATWLEDTYNGIGADR